MSRRRDDNLHHAQGWVSVRCARGHSVADVVRQPYGATLLADWEASSRDEGPRRIPEGEKIHLRCIRCEELGEKHDLQVSWEKVDGMLRESLSDPTNPQLVLSFDR